MSALLHRPVRLIAAAASLLVVAELLSALALRGGWKAVVFSIALAGMATLVVAASRFAVALPAALLVLASYALISAAIVAATATVSGDYSEAEGRAGVAAAVLVLLTMTVAPAYLVAMVIAAWRHSRAADLKRRES